MEIGQLRAIRELGDRGSIAAVAAAMHVTPSSISQQITALQRQSAVPLTFKDGRRTALTEAGEALARAAIEVEVALANARDAVSDHRGEPGGSVSVSAFHSAGLTFFGPLLAALDKPGLPEVRVSDFDVAQEDFPLLTADHAIVIAHRLNGTPVWPATLRVDPLLFEPLDVLLRRNDPLAQLSSLAPEDLRGAPWVAVHGGFPLERAVDVIAALGADEPRIVHRINELQVAASVVAATGCLALMPRYTTSLHAHPDLVLRPLRAPGVGRHIDLLLRPESMGRRSVATVVGELKKIAGSLTVG